MKPLLGLLLSVVLVVGWGIRFGSAPNLEPDVRLTIWLLLVCAILAAAVVGWLLHRLNARQTARVLADVSPTMPTERHGAATFDSARTGGGSFTDNPARGDSSGFRAYAATAPRGSTTQYRSYGYEVPTKTRSYRRHPLGSASSSAPIVETMTPARAPDMRADVGVPIGQSLFSAFVAAVVAAVIAWRLGGDVLLWTILGGVAGLAVCWLAALGLARSLVWKIERFIGDDLDGDGVQGEPDTHAMLENPGKAREEAGRVAAEHEHAIKAAELLSFLGRAAAMGTSEGKLGIGTSPQQRAKYAQLRDVLIQLGIGAWRDPNRRAAGWVLTMTPEQAAPIISRHVRELRNST